MSTEQLNPGNLTGTGHDEQAEVPDKGITLRSIIIGFLAIIPGVFWGVYGDVVSQTDLTSTSLMMPPVMILVALLPINVLIGKVRREWRLGRTELITIYVMLTAAVIMSGMGMIQFLVTTLTALPHFMSPTNDWEKFRAFVPEWLVPKPYAIENFYKGNAPIPWSAWISPIIVWSGFLFAMLFSMTCINSMLRKQWTDRERLAYPIVQLPLEMTDPKTSFFKNKLMWLGFLVAFLLETTNSIAFLVPNMPSFQLRAYNVTSGLVVSPWNELNGIMSTFYPLAIGLGFVLSTEVSFSCWFFYLLTRMERVLVVAAGWTGGVGGAVSTPPYIGQQGVGAFIGIVVMVLYLARNHLKDVWRKAINPSVNVDDSDEPLSYRWSLIGLVLGFGAMVLFCMLVGMSAWVAVAYLAIYIAFATTISRLRAEAGPAWTMGPSLNAMDSLVQGVGSRAFGMQNMVGLAYFSWFSSEMRCCAMPVTAEAMKMAQSAKIKQRVMTVVMLAAIVIGIAVGFWACLAVWYEFGAGTAKVEPWRTSMGAYPFGRISNYMANPKPADIPGLLAMVFGAGVTVLLTILRSKFVWFPLHPAGYVLANTGTLDWLWCPFLVAWLCKVTIIKYAGIKGYRTALPFFLGLVLGDYVTSSLWALAGSIFGIHMYRCFPC